MTAGGAGQKQSPSGRRTRRSTGRSRTANWSTTARGAYLATDKDYGDIELLIEYKTVAEGRQRHLPAGHPAGADLGLDQRRPRRTTRRPTRAPAGCSTTPPESPGQGPARAGRQAVRRVEPVPHPHGRRADHRLPQRQARGRPRPDGELLGPARTRRCPKAGPILLQTHGGEIRWRNIFVREIPPDEANEILAQEGRRRVRAGLQRQGLRRLAGRAGELRGDGRGDRLQAEEGRRPLHEGRVRRLRRPAGVQAAAGRQQRPGDPLPRQGATARTPAMCELQILDDDARSTPSSTRGSSTARPTAWSPPHRGYQRPVGEWNFRR